MGLYMERLGILPSRSITCLCYVITGRFKKIAAQIHMLLVAQGSTSDEKKSSIVRQLTEKIESIKLIEPKFYLRWLFLLQVYDISEQEFWKEFCLTVNEKDKVDHHSAWQMKFIRNGGFLLYCEAVHLKMKVWIS